MSARADIEKYLKKLDEIQFLSPNEPITRQGIIRVLSQMETATQELEDVVGQGGKTITLWNPNVSYGQDELVLLFKEETEQKNVEVGKREFVFLLQSLRNGNTSMPNYDIVDGIPDFTKSDWRLLNPMSYLLQDLIGMKKVVQDVFAKVLEKHVKSEHGLVKTESIENNLVKKDYSNLHTSWNLGQYSLTNKETAIDGNGSVMKKSTNGIMECSFVYSFDAKANQQLSIADKRYYYQKSPILDESDKEIFSAKYSENNMFSVTVNKNENNPSGNGFNTLRYGTNIFHAKIEFPEPYLNDEYMVFFDTYGNGQFVFGYDKSELAAAIEPTYDAIVSMPMMLNKKVSGFDVVLPIHTYFNSMQKYRIGVPWDNKFRLQVIGRYR